MNKLEFNNIDEQDRMSRVLEGTAFYACIHAPNYKQAKKFNSQPSFMVSLGLDDNNIEKAKDFGLTVHDANEFVTMPHVKLKRKVKEGKEPNEVKPDVVDSMQQKIPTSMLIGNGSKILCKFGTYWYDASGGGVGTALFKVQVRDLVPFEPSQEDSQLLMDTEGFTIETNETTEDGFDE